MDEVLILTVWYLSVSFWSIAYQYIWLTTVFDQIFKLLSLYCSLQRRWLTNIKFHILLPFMVPKIFIDKILKFHYFSERFATSFYICTDCNTVIDNSF